MAGRTLRIALLGQGFMGRAHSNAFCQVKHFFDVPFDLELRVLCGRDPARLAQMARTWGWRETSTDWRSVVARPDIDLVDIALPNALHAEAAIAAARAGKIVLCEKPLAVSVEESAAMAEAARNIPTMVWFNYRRVPAVCFARQLLDEGRLGQIYHYRAVYLQEWARRPGLPATWKLERAQAGSGVVADLASHLIDLALWLNGPIREVTAVTHTFAAGRDVEDAGLFLARFENGSIGSFEVTRFATGYRNRNAFEIHGSQGMLAFNLEDMNRLRFMDAAPPESLQGPRDLLVTGPDHPYAENFWKPGHIVGYEHTFIAALGDFLLALARGERFRPDFEDGHRVQLVLDAVERSAASGQWASVPAR
ncbi:MAG: Gfo/Idh/MocA family protein [Bryobacteraceae bacterium]